MSSPANEERYARDDSPRIVLGVTGGIAAYKSAELVRRLVDGGCDVQVVMTRAAQQFVGAATFQAVSGRRVRDDLWDAEAEAAMGHIELARWAERILVAPATAHFIATLAHGFAGDLLASVCLASEAPITIAPAMNRVMWANAAVQENCRRLAELGVEIIGPAAGAQACGEEGLGRMVEPEAIAATIFDALHPLPQVLRGRRVLVTAGPTREAIDPVRYITNRSSGKMGFAVAAAFARSGADVVLVSGPVHLPTPRGVRRVDVETAEQMYRAVHEEIAPTDIFVACAAVSDYRPEQISDTKVKRTESCLDMHLVRSPDILASVAAMKDAPFTVGFAAETDHVEAHARAKLVAKGIDMIAANRVGPSCGFDKDTNQLSIYWEGGSLELDECAKPRLAEQLVAVIADRCTGTTPRVLRSRAS
jgi:phosphopantothenoylcysteine decarboxylase / phosphopantothenate---cysteine ligase